MRRTLTIGFPHGGGPGMLIAPPGPDIAGQKLAFKAIRAARVHPDFERVEIWASDEGVARSCKLFRPAPEDKRSAPPDPKPDHEKAKPTKAKT
jgi:hypothetical protein